MIIFLPIAYANVDHFAAVEFITEDTWVGNGQSENSGSDNQNIREGNGQRRGYSAIDISNQTVTDIDEIFFYIHTFNHNYVSENLSVFWSPSHCEDTITDSTQNCGDTAAGVVAGDCNTTMMDTIPHSELPNKGYAVFDVSEMLKNELEDRDGVGCILTMNLPGDDSTETSLRTLEISNTSQLPYINVTYIPSEGLPPNIESYNLTSEGGLGCTKWNSDKTDTCFTIDARPTVKITTDEKSHCRIGVQDQNYTDLGSSRDCSGGGTTSLTCTVTTPDEITNKFSNIYIGCKDLNENENSTSTSGALAVEVDIEYSRKVAIENGAARALGTSFTSYSNQKIYARNAENTQVVSVFDKVITWMNKIWAFNVLSGNETFGTMFNISPAFYVLEFNATPEQINDTVYQLIMDTK